MPPARLHWSTASWTASRPEMPRSATRPEVPPTKPISKGSLSPQAENKSPTKIPVMIHTPGNGFRLHLLITAGFSLNDNFVCTVIVSHAWVTNFYRNPGVFARYLLFSPIPVFSVV